MIFNQFTLLLVMTLLIIIPTSCGDDAVVNTPTEPTPGPAEPTFAVDVGQSVIPYVVINSNGTQILNEPKVAADLQIYVQAQEVPTATIGIEYRGSTSYRISDKKSFGIETWDAFGNDIDASFFGFPEEEDWVVQGHVVNIDDNYIFDRTMIYHVYGYELSRMIGRYASRTQLVELELNGVYQGVYGFMEKLKRDNDRIDIKRLEPGDVDSTSITGGYIIKIDKTAGGNENIGRPLSYFDSNWDDDARYTEENSFRSQYDINGDVLNFEPYRPPYHSEQYLETYFLYEYPKQSEITDGQKMYIQNYMDEFETALLNDDFDSGERTYTDYIDLGSFADYFILNELVRNVDAYRLSTYMSKDRSGKLEMGPIWDLNIGYDSGDRIPFDGWVIDYNQYVERDAWMLPFWWTRLMEDSLFREEVKSRWFSYRSSVFSNESLLGLVDELVNYLKTNGAVERNYNRWGTVDYDASINAMKSYLEFRLTWMDGEIQAF